MDHISNSALNYSVNHLNQIANAINGPSYLHQESVKEEKLLEKIKRIFWQVVAYLFEWKIFDEKKWIEAKNYLEVIHKEEFLKDEDLLEDSLFKLAVDNCQKNGYSPQITYDTFFSEESSSPHFSPFFEQAGGEIDNLYSISDVIELPPKKHGRAERKRKKSEEITLFNPRIQPFPLWQKENN